MPKFLRLKIVSVLCPGHVRYLFAALVVIAAMATTVQAQETNGGDRDIIGATAALVTEVKAFGRAIGIEPTAALTRTVKEQKPRSMLWLWLQRAGTLALRTAIDLRLFLSFAADTKTVALEHIYRVQGYSVYFRQGDEFADSRSVVTQTFAEEDVLRRVQVILHEDLHGERNFALPWELEESLVTPLGALATVEFFRRKGDAPNLTRAIRVFARERAMSQEINELSERALKLFAAQPLDEARSNVLSLIDGYPNYRQAFRSQTQDQDVEAALEAKISHDLVYYRYFDRIVASAESVPNLRSLILTLKRLPADATVKDLDLLLDELAQRDQGAGE